MTSHDTNVSSIDINPERIGHMLKDRNWAVPAFQRGYSWTRKQVTDLLDDLLGAITEKQKEYFVGSIVAAKANSERAEIVDGQQRLATVSIMIATVRDLFIQLGDTRTAGVIEQEFLLQPGRRKDSDIQKLSLSNGDNAFFAKKVLARPSEERSNFFSPKDSHRRISEAQSCINTRLSKFLESNQPDVELHDFIDYLEKQVLVILVEVPDHQNAFTIFETLNDRSLPLAINDLLKNHLFFRAKDRIGEIQERWTEMMAIIESSTSEERSVDFLRHQWSSQHQLTREKDLFREIKGNVKLPKQAIDYAIALRTEADHFAAMHNDSHEFWTGYSTTDKEHMMIITDTLGMERITPLLLAVMLKFTKVEIRKALKAIVAWGVRLTIAGGVAGALEKKYSDVAVQIRNGAVTTSKELYQGVKDLIPNDADFKAAVQLARVPKSKLARYYLAVLEEHKRAVKQPEQVTNRNEDQVNLEHVLPQNRRANTWATFDEELYSLYRYRLGNLVLMKADENGANSSDDFTAKRGAYASSSLQLTRMVADEVTWTPATIEARQKVLAELAVTAWSAKG